MFGVGGGLPQDGQEEIMQLSDFGGGNALRLEQPDNFQFAGDFGKFAAEVESGGAG